MFKVLLCILFAAFALLLMVTLVAEDTLAPDAVDQPAMEAGSVKTLDAEFVAVTIAPSPEAEPSNRDYIPRDVRAETTFTTNETTAVERGGRDGILFGGVSRL